MMGEVEVRGKDENDVKRRTDHLSSKCRTLIAQVSILLTRSCATVAVRHAHVIEDVVLSH